MTNRLATATSPYLQQHADNPVHWQEWGDAAFDEARRRDVPVFISIGYAACHWCHVMAHESFEDPVLAALLNENFVSIKVDREERPDVDAVYMSATVALTGQGGWPMTVFATPEGQPFYCGTYFPPSPRQGMPSFTQLLHGVAEAWRERREQALETAGTVAAHIRQRQLTAGHRSGKVPDSDTFAAATERLSGVFDAKYGGFGSAPKFPPATVLPALCAGNERAREMAVATMKAMAYGGIYDQLAGGFSRYSVDAQWVVPHFEKMLYDNASLLSAYAAWIPTDTTGLATRVCSEILDFLETDLRTDAGAYASSLDADTDGVEGLTYAWTPAQLAEVLGEADAQLAAELLKVTEHGTFEHGTSTLQMAVAIDSKLGAKWPIWRAALREARATRPQPGRDDKVVTAWNALAISGLCDLYRVTGNTRALIAARRVADVLIDTHVIDGVLVRASIGGTAGAVGGMLEDYAALAAGLLRLHLATAARRYLEIAIRLIDRARSLFVDDEALYADAPSDSDLIHRPAEVFDNPTPSGIASLVDALALAHAITGEGAYSDAVERLLVHLSPVLEQAPNAAGTIWRVAQSWAAGMPTYVVAGPEFDEDTSRLEVEVREIAGPGALILVGHDEAASPLLAGRVGSFGRLFACRGGVCDRPVTHVADLQVR